MIQAGIIQPIDYAGRVRQGFEYGQQKRREMDTDKALQALMANPDDPKAISMLGKADPAKGMAYQSQRREQEQARAKQLTEVFGRAARAAKTPQQWDAIATWLSQNGVPGAANVVGKFSPEMRMGYMAQAGLEEDKDDAQTSIQRNYKFFQEIDPKLAEAYVRNQAEGSPLIASNGDGTFTIVPRSMVPGAPQAAPQAASGEVPPLPPGFVLDGGPTPQASGGFPASGN